jgi:hypothetical protein
MADGDLDTPDLGPDDQRGVTMTHSPTRVAAAALLGATATACLVALPPPADAALPKRHTTYSVAVYDPVYQVTADITIKVGKDKHKVKKMTVVLTCAEGTSTMVVKRIKIGDDGSFLRQMGQPFPTSQVEGQFKTKHKVFGGVDTDPGATCGGEFYQYTAKD